jgi:hypothetical protein
MCSLTIIILCRWAATYSYRTVAVLVGVKQARRCTPLMVVYGDFRENRSYVSWLWPFLNGLR